MSGGTFAISLDFALYWGMRNRQPFSACQTRLQGVYQAIPALLTAFQQANIHATWAVVGLVFFRDTAELRYHLPSILPQYHDRRLNPFLYLPNTERHPDLIPYYYAPQLIQAIQRYAGQEIASHSFSHFNIGATGATLESFTADVQAAKNIATRFGIALKAMFFHVNNIVPLTSNLCHNKVFKHFVAIPLVSFTIYPQNVMHLPV